MERFSVVPSGLVHLFFRNQGLKSLAIVWPSLRDAAEVLADPTILGAAWITNGSNTTAKARM
jgi:hypothetical protein